MLEFAIEVRMFEAEFDHGLEVIKLIAAIVVRAVLDLERIGSVATFEQDVQCVRIDQFAMRMFGCQVFHRLFDSVKNRRFVELARNHRIIRFDDTGAWLFNDAVDLDEPGTLLRAGNEAIPLVILILAGADARKYRTAAIFVVCINKLL